MGNVNAGVAWREEFLLRTCQTRANFHDIVVCALIDLRILASDEVKNVHGQRAIPCANLVDD